MHSLLKKNCFYALVGSSHENFIVLHHYVQKILKSHDYKLVHFIDQGTCVAFYFLISSDCGLVKTSKDLKLGLIYLSLLMIENYCDALFSFYSMMLYVFTLNQDWAFYSVCEYHFW